LGRELAHAERILDASRLALSRICAGMALCRHPLPAFKVVGKALSEGFSEIMEFVERAPGERGAVTFS
jgi:hypothetical protein